MNSTRCLPGGVWGTLDVPVAKAGVDVLEGHPLLGGGGRLRVHALVKWPGLSNYKNVSAI